MTVVVPTTPIIGLYEELHRKGVSREQKLARARGFVANPASLAVMFHDSVLRLATYKPADEGFYKVSTTRSATSKRPAPPTLRFAFAMRADCVHDRAARPHCLRPNTSPHPAFSACPRPR